MFLKIWRFITIMFVGLSMGPAIGHILEMPAKLNYEGSLWLKLSHTLYPAFGLVGGVFEVTAVITSIVLVFLVRQHKSALLWSIFAAICMVLTHASFWIWIAPVNSVIKTLTPETLPSDWKSLRNQWEYTHATRAILQALALACLIVSLLIEIPNVSTSQRKTIS